MVTTEPRAGADARLPRLGLLHTSPVHVATFDELGGDEAAGIELVHLVRADLLATACEQGLDAVRAELTEAIGSLDADVVLCTCSTLGAVAERVGSSRPVLRVDRPMAAAAVATGGPVAVLAALESTLAPTADLIHEEADLAGVRVEVLTTVVEGAWELFEAGDLDRYLDAVAAAGEAVTGAAAIVLAQASMAAASARTRVAVPVLSSPRLGLRAAADLFRARSAGSSADCR